jgi:hypothetical protein
MISGNKNIAGESFLIHHSLFQGIESAMRGGLEEIFGSLNEQTLRAMRRTMPITRTKMEWNVNAVRMNRQIRK